MATENYSIIDLKFAVNEHAANLTSELKREYLEVIQEAIVHYLNDQDHTDNSRIKELLQSLEKGMDAQMRGKI